MAVHTPLVLKNGWMQFNSLDNFSNIIAVYTICYSLTGKEHENELWTKRIKDFKDGDLKAKKGAGFLLWKSLDELLKYLNIEFDRCGLICALSSSDEKINMKKNLSKVAKWVAKEKLKLKWMPNLLSKSKHEALHKIRGANARDNTVNNKYFSGIINNDIENLFIFDDIVTRGSTMSEIARAVIDKNQSINIYGVALAKSERPSYAPVSNENVSKKFNEYWVFGEEINYKIK